MAFPTINVLVLGKHDNNKLFVIEGLTLILSFLGKKKEFLIVEIFCNNSCDEVREGLIVLETLCVTYVH
jgi:hypothetical protein